MNAHEFIIIFSTIYLRNAGVLWCVRVCVFGAFNSDFLFSTRDMFTVDIASLFSRDCYCFCFPAHTFHTPHRRRVRNLESIFLTVFWLAR
jgi:hypothetical protein